MQVRNSLFLIALTAAPVVLAQANETELSTAFGEGDERYEAAIAAGEFDRALGIMENLEGTDSPALVPLLMALGKAAAAAGDASAQADRYTRAIAIHESAYPTDELARAELALEAGTDLIYMSRSSRGEAFLEDALSTFETSLGSQNERTAIAAMSLGDSRFGENRFATAELALLKALEFYAGRDEFQLEEFRLRTMLSEIYISDNKSDAALPHLIELERLGVFSESREYLPIYKREPEYPPRAAARGLSGSVLVRYTVSRDGSVRDATVIESSSPLFNTAALHSAERYRYVPRIIDGQPVEVPGVTTRIIFALRD